VKREKSAEKWRQHQHARPSLVQNREQLSLLNKARKRKSDGLSHDWTHHRNQFKVISGGSCSPPRNHHRSWLLKQGN